MRPVYLDNAASTRPAPEVVAEMQRAATEVYGNPSSAHTLGAAAARELAAARGAVAALMGAEPGEIVFTSGGTEANALALMGVAARRRPQQLPPASAGAGASGSIVPPSGRRPHAVVTAIEHPSVLETARLLRGSGFELTEVPVGPTGIVDVVDVLAAVREETALVSVMLVNNELGTLQPVADISRALFASSEASHPSRPRRHLHFHVDAVQALGFVPFRAPALGVDSIAVSAHKIHGPKGIGALWMSPRAKVAPLWDGGRQERGLRSGTENLPGIVGFARAATLADRALRDGVPAAVASLRNELERRLLTAIPEARTTVPTSLSSSSSPSSSPSSSSSRAPHISSIAIPQLPAEPLLHALESRAVIASAGSACASRTRGPSHVLSAIGIDDRTAVLRFSLSRETTPADVTAATEALVAAVAEVRPMANARPRA